MNNVTRKQAKKISLQIIKMRMYLIRNRKGYGNAETQRRCEMLFEAFSSRFSEKLFLNNFEFLKTNCPTNKQSWFKSLDQLKKIIQYEHTIYKNAKERQNVIPTLFEPSK